MPGCRFRMVSSTATFHWLRRTTISRTISPEIVPPADFHLIGSCLRPLEPSLCAVPVTRFWRLALARTFFSVCQPRPGVVSSSGGLARGSRHAPHRRPRAEKRGGGCRRGPAQACGGGARGDAFSLGPRAGAGHPWCVSLRGGCGCGGGVGGGAYARRACRRVGSLLRAPHGVPPSTRLSCAVSSHPRQRHRR